MEPSRKAVVESYVTHFQSSDDGMAFSGMNCSVLAASTIRLVRRDVPNAPFYKQLDLADRLPDYYNPNADMFGRYVFFVLLFLCIFCVVYIAHKLTIS